MDKNCTKQAELLLLLLLLHGSGGRQGGAPCFEFGRPRISRSRRLAKIPERQWRPLRLISCAAIFERNCDSEHVWRHRYEVTSIVENSSLKSVNRFFLIISDYEKLLLYGVRVFLMKMVIDTRN